MVGSQAYPNERSLLITAEAGGSKVPGAAVEGRTRPPGCPVGAGHHGLPLPRGTSEWNRVEHSPWADVSMNWRGEPLAAHEVVSSLIGATTNKGASGRGPLGLRLLPPRHQDHQSHPGLRAPHRPCFSWRLELHRAPRCQLKQPSNYDAVILRRDLTQRGSERYYVKDDRPRVVIVTDTHLDALAPDGFSARYATIVSTLLRAFNLRLVLVPAHYRSPREAMPKVELPISPEKVLALASRRSLIRTDDRLSMVASRLPSFSSRTFSIDKLNELAQEFRPDVVILLGRHLAHIAYKSRWLDARIIAFLEEDFDRHTTLSFTKGSAILDRIIVGLERVDRRHHYEALRSVLYRGIAITEGESRWMQSLLAPVDITVLPTLRPPFQSRPEQIEYVWDFVIVGDLSSKRNVEPIVELVSLPECRNLKAVLCGPSPAMELVAAVRKCGNVQLAGYVRNLAPYLWRSRVAIVPTTTVTGIKSTVLHAWSTDTPLVARHGAPLGVDVLHGENVMLGRSPRGLLDAVREIEGSPALACTLRDGGRQALSQFPTRDEFEALLRSLCLGAYKE